MPLKKGLMRIEDNHAHATTRYAKLAEVDFHNLLADVFRVKNEKLLSLTVHLPFEIQHPQFYPNLKLAQKFISYGESLKEIFQINLYWENAPELVVDEWHLSKGQTTWNLVPKNIDLCLDVGHLMLGAKDKKEANQQITKIFTEREDQIKHLHIHENDLIHDLHKPIGNVLSEEWVKKVTKKTSYIFEKGE